jgi:hypothetical protein
MRAVNASAVLILLASSAWATGSERGSNVLRVVAGGGEIPTIRTGRGITTMVSFPAEAREAICGDLFDVATGAGTFVVQRSGKDLFIKPVRPSARSNLFVKTESTTYTFELTVVEPAAAVRIVYVDDAAPERALQLARSKLASERAALEARLAEERQELDRAATELRAEAEQRAGERAAELVIAALQGQAFVKVIKPVRSRGPTLEVRTGDAICRFRGRIYLRCWLRNRGRVPQEVAAFRCGTTVVAVDVELPPGVERPVVLSLPESSTGELVVVSRAGSELVRFGVR